MRPAPRCSGDPDIVVGIGGDAPWCAWPAVAAVVAETGGVGDADREIVGGGAEGGLEGGCAEDQAVEGGGVVAGVLGHVQRGLPGVGRSGNAGDGGGFALVKSVVQARAGPEAELTQGSRMSARLLIKAVGTVPLPAGVVVRAAPVEKSTMLAAFWKACCSPVGLVALVPIVDAELVAGESAERVSRGDRGDLVDD